MQLGKDERFSFRALTIPFVLVHLIALAGPFLVGIRWEWVALCIGSYYVRQFAVTAGYHRYFSHRTYKTSRVFQFVMALLGTTAAQKGVLWWSAHHRDHHRYSDTEKDIHSPIRGIWWSHVGWILCDRHLETKFDRVKDLSKYPELRWLNDWHVVPVVGLAVIMFLIGGWGALVWGFFVSTVLLWHGTFLVNSWAHLFGYRRFKTGDTSRNSLFVALLTLGEGWHNNHHYHQATVRQGWYWYEIDISYYILRMLSWFGIVWDLRLPPTRKINEGRAIDAARGRFSKVTAVLSALTQLLTR